MNRIFCVPLRRSALVWNSAKHINYCNLSSESFLRLNPLLLITTTTATTTTRTTTATTTITTTTAKARQTIYQKSFRSTKGTKNFILSFSFSFFLSGFSEETRWRVPIKIWTSLLVAITRSDFHCLFVRTSRSNDVDDDDDDVGNDDVDNDNVHDNKRRQR